MRNLNHTSGNDKSEPPINTIEPDKNIEASTFFQKLGFKVSLVDEELWLPLAKFAEVKAEIDHLINEARIAELESIKSTWSEENAGSRIATGLLQIDLEERINNLQDIKEGE